MLTKKLPSPVELSSDLKPFTLSLSRKTKRCGLIKQYLHYYRSDVPMPMTVGMESTFLFEKARRR